MGVLAYSCQEGGFQKIPNKWVHTNCCRFLVLFVLHVAAVELVNSGCLFVGGQITLFSTKLVLDTGWKWYLLQFCIPLEALAGGFVCSLGLSARKKGTFCQPRFWNQPLFLLPARVLLLALQPYCKCSLCGLFASTVYLRDWYNSDYCMKVSLLQKCVIDIWQSDSNICLPLFQQMIWDYW